jgi:hypothetical protein
MSVSNARIHTSEDIDSVELQQVLQRKRKKAGLVQLMIPVMIPMTREKRPNLSINQSS